MNAVGVDPSPWMLARARGKAARRASKVAFRPGAIEALPFPDASFDRVFSTLMFHHLSEGLQRRGASEIRRVLRPGGFALVLDFSAVRNPLFLFFAFHVFNRAFRRQMLGGLKRPLEEAGFASLERVDRWMAAVEVFRAVR